jgi:WD40 repeat protein
MSASTLLSPSRTTVTNFSTTQATRADNTTSYEEGVWVLQVCNGDSWLGCALSNGSIQVYDQERLQLIHSYPATSSAGGQQRQTTDLACDSFNALISSSRDGSVSLFDVRQPSPALSFQLEASSKGEEALSVALGYQGALAAVGSSKAQIHFFDINSGGKLLGSYQDAHTEDVTRVRFQPDDSTAATTSMLVSGSEDGLACLFDTAQPSEELALQGVLNVQSSLREVGFFGPAYEGVYCLTGSETLSVWHHDTAQRICDFGPEVRQNLTKLAGMPVDYLVDCHWASNDQQLTLLTGNHAGDGTLFKVDAGTIAPLHKLQNGHRGDIRSWCPTSNDDIFCTVGEDARLCEWNRLNTGGAVTSAPSPTKGAPARRQKSKKSSKRSPY